ncbi:hypothetical protein RFI_02219 [Reticulomyxa filosa]|uniref:SOS1/NGEF-like PH domain-containing protein n=1 Tax=Reticulomyxa filosa TaxID=46433 RepID=X6P9Z0_RETFI|nr:hypothetical protein RFI_02219 [Reticulomyxa filosa]|eukprot:ETO34864.1 hypothetical protein RFI_02219 [Reticulomyxa filosa]
MDGRTCLFICVCLNSNFWYHELRQIVGEPTLTMYVVYAITSRMSRYHRILKRCHDCWNDDMENHEKLMDTIKHFELLYAQSKNITFSKKKNKKKIGLKSIESQLQLIPIENLISEMQNETLLKRGRMLIRSGDLKMESVRRITRRKQQKMRHVMLFNDCLVWCGHQKKSKNGQIYVWKGMQSLTAENFEYKPTHGIKQGFIFGSTKTAHVQVLCTAVEQTEWIRDIEVCVNLCKKPTEVISVNTQKPNIVRVNVLLDLCLPHKQLGEYLTNTTGWSEDKAFEKLSMSRMHLWSAMTSLFDDVMYFL